MARPRAFDEDEALMAAMMLFWRHGYGATTYRLIERETGIGLRPLHNTFGEKDALFARALRLYRKMARSVLDGAFAAPGREAIMGLFEGMVAPAPEDDPANMGCLMVATVFEVGEPPEAVAAEIAAYREMFRARFEEALRADGTPEAEERAEFLVGALWGVLSQIRLARRTTAGAPAARVVVETVRGW